MPEYGCYGDVDTLKSRLSIADTTDDTQLLQHLEAASRWVDDMCHRHFYVVTATRYFTAKQRGSLVLPYDLLSITTLKTDDDGDRTYENTWASTDYDLVPYDKFPKDELQTTPQGDYGFSLLRKGVEIAGIWGYGDGWSATPYEDSGATGTVATTTGTTLTSSSGSLNEVGQVILCESEQMYITAISSNSLTVKRGVNGTTAAVHSGKSIYIYRFPDGIREACLLKAAELYLLANAPAGTIGSAAGYGEMNVQPRISPLLPLQPFRRLNAG